MPLSHCHSDRACRLAALALAAGVLAGCTGESASRFLVAPGKYVLFNCAQIKQAADENSKRQQVLEGLMVKAGNSSAGQMVSAAAYRPEYLQLRGEMADLRQAAADKKCKFVPGEGQSARAAGVGTLH